MFNPLKLFGSNNNNDEKTSNLGVVSAALRIPAGLFILNQGLGKFKADEDTQKGLHGMATNAFPFFKEFEHGNFVKLLASLESTLGTSLLLPFVSNRLAGAGLTAFAGGLLTMYFSDENLTLDDGIRPAPAGVPIAKDSFLFGMGAALLALPKK